MADLAKFRKGDPKLAMEFIGTFALVYTVQVSATLDPALAAVAIGLSLMVFVYVGATISGANYNPAVTIGLCLRGKMEWPTAIQYMLAQCAGGIAGSYLGWATGGAKVTIGAGEGHGLIQVFLAEMIFTSFLVLTVLGSATMASTANNQWTGATVGLIVVAGGATVGPVSGGMFNPAVSVGLYSAFNFSKIIFLIVAIAAQKIGAVLGAFMFMYIAPEELEHLDLVEQQSEATKALLPKK